MIAAWLASIETDYGVNPYIFAVLYLIKMVCIYYCLARAWRALRAGQRSLAMGWVVAYLSALTIPFVYVFLFGHNFPWWVRPALVAILVVIVVGALHRLRMVVRDPGT